MKREKVTTEEQRALIERELVYAGGNLREAKRRLDVPALDKTIRRLGMERRLEEIRAAARARFRLQDDQST